MHLTRPVIVSIGLLERPNRTLYLMSTNLNLRKKKFTDDLSFHLAKLPDGAWSYRQKVKLILNNFTNDLGYLGILPRRVGSLKTEDFYVLVNYWKAIPLKAKTIKNRLSVIRKVLSTLPKPVIVPSNPELGVVLRSSKAKRFLLFKPVNPYEIAVYPAFLVKEVCIMQHLFGLKLHEAIRLKPSMVFDYYLEVPRSISFNKKDRRVPIYSAEQKEFVLKFTTDLKNLLPIPAKHYEAFVTLYHHTEKELKTNFDDYFRYCYIRRRHEELVKRYDEFTALDIIQAEIGVSTVSQVKGALTCQESF